MYKLIEYKLKAKPQKAPVDQHPMSPRSKSRRGYKAYTGDGRLKAGPLKSGKGKGKGTGRGNGNGRPTGIISRPEGGGERGSESAWTTSSENPSSDSLACGASQSSQTDLRHRT